MKKAFTIILFLGTIACAHAQGGRFQSNTFTHRLTSDENLEYVIRVTVPPTYDDALTYPTLYYLDAWWLEDVVKGTYNLLNRSKAVEDVILVGISIDGNEYEFNEQRTRDYTPSPYDLALTKFPVTIPLEPKSFMVTNENSGRSSQFRDFIADKVFPELLEHYAVNPDRRAFLGHSFGGLFGVYEMIADDTLFDSFIILSPALWWNKSKGLYEKLDQTIGAAKKQTHLFVSYGDAEGLPITIWTNKLNDYLNAKQYPGLKYKFVIYPEEDHVSVLPESIYEGLAFLYGK